MKTRYQTVGRGCACMLRAERIFLLGCLAALFLMGATVGSAQSLENVESNRQAGIILEQSYPVLEKTLVLYDQHELLPDRALFKRDKKDNQRRIDTLLAKAIDILEVSPSYNIRTEIEKQQARIEFLRGEIATLSRERLSAPDKALLGLDNIPFYKTRQGYDAAIADKKNEITACEEQIEQLTEEFIGYLALNGVAIRKDQARQLLNSVDGGDYIALSAIFENIKNLAVQFQYLSSEADEDVEIVKKYYGLYVILLMIADNAQERYITQIDENYLPQLETFEEVAEEIIRSSSENRETHTLSDANRRAEEANIRSAEITLATIARYRQYLRKQQEALIKRNLQVKEDLSTARNTYKTVTLSHLLVEMIRDSSRNFQALMTMEPPPIIPFQNQAMQKEFEKLSLRMSDR
ncbi:MAG: hypothetical protein EOM20_17545 [Spartobacteria bacterium]|nr:hypothetical protein [Spartobacteria bacterium]